jgi:hypothetical protein
MFTTPSIRKVAHGLEFDHNDMLSVLKQLRVFVFDKKSFPSNKWIRQVLEYTVTQIDHEWNEEIELLVPMVLHFMNQDEMDVKHSGVLMLSTIMNERVCMYRDVVFQNLHKMLTYRSSRELLDLTMTCAIRYLKLFNKEQELLTVMEDFCGSLEYCSIISTENDPQMMKNVLVRTGELIPLLGFDIARFLKRLMSLLLDYPYYTNSQELLDQCAKLFRIMMETCSPRFKCGQVNGHCLRILQTIDQKIEFAPKCSNVILLLQLIQSYSPSTVQQFNPSEQMQKLIQEPTICF